MQILAPILGVIGFIAAISIVNLLASRRTAEYSVCLENRRVIEDAETSYYVHIKTHSSSLQELLETGYLNKIPTCPTGGVFAWVPYEVTSPYYQSSIGCSFQSTQDVQEEDTKKEKKSKKKK